MEHWLWILLAARLFGLTAGDNIYPVKDQDSKREGQSVTLSCKYETGVRSVALHWYRQNSDLQVPQFILWKGAKGYTSENIPAGRYGSTTSDSSTELTIRDLTLADTTLYYCGLFGYGSLGVGYDSLIFGKPIQLKVRPKAPLKPTLFVLSPLQPDGVSVNTVVDEVCLATDFSPQDGEMVMNTQAGPVTVSTNNAVVSPTLNTFNYVGVSNEIIYSCELHDTFSNNDQIGLCANLRPEKGKLNFYLLVMNGVRVVFTKVVAFSTIFTIRALLH